MREVTDECVGCTTDGLPCMGDSCPNRHVTRLYCDKCDEEVDTLYYGSASGKELCAECALAELEKVEAE